MWTGAAWDWLMRTDAGLGARIAGGAGVFGILAVAELRRRGRAARRWKEYVFLACTALAAMAYGAVNDQITSRISWEYFYYGKDLEPVLGKALPPDAWALSWEAAKIGMKATWTAGLIIGVILLVVNNPNKRGRPVVGYPVLIKAMGIVFGVTVCCAVVVGIICGRLPQRWWLEDVAVLAQAGVIRPARFMAVYGVHLGGYVGGLIGVTLAAGWVWGRRRALATLEPALAVRMERKQYGSHL